MTVRATQFGLGLSVAVIAPCPVLALDVPAVGQYDTRVRVVNYNPMQVYRVIGVLRSVQQVVFSDDEEVLNVAVGDTVGWETAAVRNVLFLKPVDPHPPTNMIVTTLRGNGETRNYSFELHTSKGDQAAGSEAYFQVKFAYPIDEANRRRAEAKVKAEAAEQTAVGKTLDNDAFYGSRNYAYSAQGSIALQPSHVWDNGKITHLRFPANMEVPSVYVVNEDGTEAVAQYDTRGDYIVLHQVAREIRLRRGGVVLCITNENFSDFGIDPGTNTVSSGVARVRK
ncbi:TrbG/VirB9 family P-type conjugative transfer protein [Aureimonas sp. N4]|uniref:TrbG/VirB9 family P-type conjugative transfer protein n=1 Tax=Aureimonas sp. N4 TaxID=1638165 RepID=UPI00078331D9|nr:TrbG/VirB9 family P-type conjugative transfer protein [Aureimonas sp. N4]